jgi:hypothetical protein
LSEIPHRSTRILTRARGPAGAKMASMRTTHAPDRRDPRAVRIAQVKFMALPMEDMDIAPTCSGNRTIQARGLFALLRSYVIRVIGRLEAARP